MRTTGASLQALLAYDRLLVYDRGVSEVTDGNDGRIDRGTEVIPLGGLKSLELLLYTELPDILDVPTNWFAWAVPGA
jgi:hypothetical protein